MASHTVWLSSLVHCQGLSRKAWSCEPAASGPASLASEECRTARRRDGNNGNLTRGQPGTTPLTVHFHCQVTRQGAQEDRSLMDTHHRPPSTTPSQSQERAQKTTQGLGCWAAVTTGGLAWLVLSFPRVCRWRCCPAKALIRNASSLILWLMVTHRRMCQLGQQVPPPWPALALPDLTTGRNRSATDATILPWQSWQAGLG